MIEVECTLNGKKKKLSGHPMARLLDVLRESGKLTGTKEGCGEGECGACSVQLDGEVVMSCLVPLGQVAGSQITTVEGLASSAIGKKLQDAFIRCGGAQCGICTPGMLIAGVRLLEKNPWPTVEQIREGLAGNLCRCTGYMKIIDAVQEASREG